MASDRIFLFVFNLQRGGVCMTVYMMVLGESIIGCFKEQGEYSNCFEC